MGYIVYTCTGLQDSCCPPEHKPHLPCTRNNETAKTSPTRAAAWIPNFTNQSSEAQQLTRQHMKYSIQNTVYGLALRYWNGIILK